ncbi:MAG: hypothetical protein IJ383_05180 [Bacteroidales bacterium]|nr:hypothetical protein [Bacteroidales bacterium]
MQKLRYILLGMMVSLALIFVSCEMEEGEYTPVEFHVHESCAMRNPPNKVAKKVIYTENEFNSSFIYAVDGQPDIDPVDFTSSFVVAVCAESSNVRRNIEITEVLTKDYVLYVKYKINTYDKLSYKMAPCVVASISRDYSGYDIAFYDVTGME